ncbi:MAG TPA: tetratricopeptide repeat protein [Vicinamibacterales bacterium]|jgi:tetratricopeptide (TPR) repeat protein|nr:tetratricopeptide repeat protein [Vicinamibacterales bacterium]
MRADSIVFGISGVLVGVIIGWVLGSQQARGGRVATAAPAAQSQPAGQTAQTGSRAVPVDPERAKALESVAQQNPKDVQPRVQLGNLYFDAEQYPQAISWYEQAFALNNRDANVSTDLGVAYYYTNQPDRAIKQFEHSLSIDPKHLKTLLNMGIVRAFGKQDLEGAAKAWEEVVAIAPNSQEGQAAKKGLEGLRNAHPPGTTGAQ